VHKVRVIKDKIATGDDRILNPAEVEAYDESGINVLSGLQPIFDGTTTNSAWKTSFKAGWTDGKFTNFGHTGTGDPLNEPEGQNVVFELKTPTGINKVAIGDRINDPPRHRLHGTKFELLDNDDNVLESTTALTNDDAVSGTYHVYDFQTKDWEHFDETRGMYQKFDGVGGTGKHLGGGGNYTLSGCTDLCNNTPGCSGFNYSTSGTQCYMKSGTGTGSITGFSWYQKME